MTRRLVCSTVLLAAGLTVLYVIPASGRPGEPVQRRGLTVGHSVQGRPITAIEIGDFDSSRKALVVGCIHGNECAGIAVTLRLIHTAPPPEVDLWVVPDLNPDGNAAGTRGNAHGVDLNRNFPWRWTRLAGVYDSGRAPLSEPESRAADSLIERVRPTVSIWFHQHLDLVDDSSGSRSIERRFAGLARLPLVQLRREPGSAVTWQSHCFSGGTAFVVELPSGPVGRRGSIRLDRAVDGAVRAAPERRPSAAAGCRPSS